MIKIYYILVSFFYFLALPFLLILSFKKKYRDSIPARFFLWKNLQKTKNGIHLHGCSLGEINALKSFITELKETEKNITVTTTTNTGFVSAKKISNIEVNFLPFEIFIPFWLQKQKKLIVVEAEFWLLLFYFIKKNGGKTILLSGRITQKSFPKYLKFKFFYTFLFKFIDIFLVQTQEDKIRFMKFGINSEKIKVIGNIKLLKPIIKSKNLLEIKPDREIIVGASTHQGEEILILNEFKKYGQGRLILVPRHPERFDEVFSIIADFGKQNNLTFSRFSENQNFISDIILFDQMGRLLEIYRKSSTVILGGSFFENIGGHNPIEPVSFSNRLISGKFYHNQIELYNYISHIQIVDGDNISKALKENYQTSSLKIENLELKEIIQHF